MTKTALVTGAASGIGRATSILLSQEGYRLALLDLEKSDLEGTLKHLMVPDAHRIFRADVRSKESLGRAFQEIEREFGHLDAAVNNAGIEGNNMKFLDCTEEEYDGIMGVNLKGVFFCLQYELALMSKKGKGSIVNLSSVLGQVGGLGISIYSASKHGVLGFTKSLAVEFARKGVRINAVCPGGVETAMIKRLREEAPGVVSHAEKLHPMARFSNPDEIARAILWLLSDDSSFVTGTGLSVDGGYTAV